MATPALTPELALRYLEELSTDIRAAVLLDPGGELAAQSGDGPALRELALELLGAADAADAEEVAEVEVSAPPGAVYAVRRGGWTAVVVAGRFALSSVLRYDMRQVLGDVAPEAA